MKMYLYAMEMEFQEMAVIAAKYVNTTDKHIFLTGRAGTGKTTFLRHIVNNTYKNTIIAAPTGIAAINAGGVTLHSLLQLPFGIFIPENIPLADSNSPINTPQTLFRERKMNSTKRKLLQELELLIIDEVSMLRADLLDCMDHILRNLRRNSSPFGGVQILFIGDLLQLPPVVKEADRQWLNPYYKSVYFFNARALQQTPPIQVELQKIYRQSDQDFIDLLNRLRHNEQTNADIRLLNEYHQPQHEIENKSGYIYLTTHNYKADQINQNRLKALEGEIFSFDAEISVDFPENMYPTEKQLNLKVDTQVMFIKNDPTGEGRFFNGKIGKVSSLSDKNIVVKCDKNHEITVDKYTWENIRYTLNKSTNEIEEKHLGSFVQYPIKLAWAVTIHKSQGLTFEKAVLDLEGTFAPGQLYVALSRLTSLNGLILASHLPSVPPEIDDALISFSKSFQEEDFLTSELDKHRREFLMKFTTHTFRFDRLATQLTYHLRGFNKAENRSIKQQYLDWTKEFHNSFKNLNEVGYKFINQVEIIVREEDYISILHNRMAKASAYFVPILTELKDEILQHKNKIKDKKKVKGYIKELEEIEALIIHYIKQIIKLDLLVQSAKENKILTKTALQQSSFYQSLKSTVSQKKDKTPTSVVSFDMYKQGKSIAEIAKERGFVESTILGHLCQFIEQGEIDATKIISADKIDMISKAYAAGHEKSSEIKAVMGDEYSYAEIKVALAHIKSLKPA